MDVLVHIQGTKVVKKLKRLNNMENSIDAISEGFTLDEEAGVWMYNFGDGYQLCLEPLMWDGQFYMALYKDEGLLIPKVCMKLGKEESV